MVAILLQPLGCYSGRVAREPGDPRGRKGPEMLPIAADIAVNAVHNHVGSALPKAPVVPDPTPRESRTRTQFAAFLRASAQRRARLADRLDPCAGRMGPITA